MGRIDIVGHVGIEHHLLLARDQHPGQRQPASASKGLVAPLRGRACCVGGSAAFGSRMAQELGVPFNLISSVGANDPDARVALAQLGRLRFPLSGLQRIGRTNVFYSLWSPDRHRRELYLSVGSEPESGFIEAALARDAEGAVIYDLGGAEALSAIVERCHAHGRRVALALNQNAALMDKWVQSLAGKVELVSMSQAGLAALCRDESLDRGVRHLLAIQGGGGAPIFVVTKGSEGAVVIDEGAVVELAGQTALEFPLGGGDMLALATFVRRLDGAATRTAVEEAASYTTRLMLEYGQRLAR